MTSLGGSGQPEQYLAAVMVLCNTIQFRLKNIPPANLALLGEVLEDAGNDLLNLSDEVRAIVLEQRPRDP